MIFMKMIQSLQLIEERMIGNENYKIKNILIKTRRLR